MAIAKPTPCHTYLSSILEYRPSTGELIWRVRRNSHGGKVRPGVRAGCLGDYPGGPRRVIRIDGELYPEARIIWRIVTGDDPPLDMVVDHVNNDATDNKWPNLRVTTATQNKWNTQKRRNSSLPKGVTLVRETGRYKVRVAANGVTHSGGTHASVDEAVVARDALAERLHGEYKNKGD